MSNSRSPAAVSGSPKIASRSLSASGSVDFASASGSLKLSQSDNFFKGNTKIQSSANVQQRKDEGPNKIETALFMQNRFIQGKDPNADLVYEGNYCTYKDMSQKAAAIRWETARESAGAEGLTNWLKYILLAGCPPGPQLSKEPNPYLKEEHRSRSRRRGVNREVYEESIKPTKESFKEEEIVATGPKPKKQVLFESLSDSGDAKGTISPDKARQAAQYLGHVPIEGTPTGDLTIKEFYRFLYDCADPLDNELEKAFGLYDTLDRGFVTENQFKAVLILWGDNPLSEEEATKVMSHIGISDTPVDVKHAIDQLKSEGSPAYLKTLGVDLEAYDEAVG